MVISGLLETPLDLSKTITKKMREKISRGLHGSNKILSKILSIDVPLKNIKRSIHLVQPNIDRIQNIG